MTSIAKDHWTISSIGTLLELVRDVVSELSERNERIHQLEDEIEIKSDVEIRQQEEITNLLSKTITLDNKIKKVSSALKSLFIRSSSMERLEAEAPAANC